MDQNEIKKAKENTNIDLCEKINEKINKFIDLKNIEKEENSKKFNLIRNNINNNIFNISNDFLNIDSWDELLKLNDDFQEEGKPKELDADMPLCFILFCLVFCGPFFSLIQLVGVQEMIIILNSILNELKDELKLYLYNTPRKINFYENLRRASYRETPDIDVAMATSFIGILIIKALGFALTNIIFQLIPALWFLFFFFFFSFHTEKELENNYNLSEIIMLLLTYIIEFILVGASSSLSLKEITDGCKFLTKIINDKEDKSSNKSSNEIKNFFQVDTYINIIFFFKSCLSLLITILLNKKVISTLKDNISQKKLLYYISLI